MISYWTSVGSERKDSEVRSKSDGAISDMKDCISSAVASRGSSADREASVILESKSMSGRR